MTVKPTGKGRKAGNRKTNCQVIVKQFVSVFNDKINEAKKLVTVYQNVVRYRNVTITE